MSKTRVKLRDRFLAALLSVLMIFAMIPVTTQQAFAMEAEKFAITVTDGENPIEGAVVTLTGAADCVGFEMEATTDENGVAAFLTDEMIVKLSTTATEEYVDFDVSISKDGYETHTSQIKGVPAARGLESGNSFTKELTVAAPDTATVCVTVTGNATVEVDGIVQNSATVDIGTEVPVEITPADGSYIKSLTVGGENVPVTKGEAYVGTIKADADVTIVATVVKEFTVSAPAVEGGTITLNGGNDASITVDENTKVTVGVTAAEGYHISAVAIDGVAQSLETDTTFSKEITITADTEIAVVFAKVYTITVTHNNNGTVITEPATAGGSVTVVKDSTVKITADPSDNYRISEVKINDVADETITGANYGAEDKYIKELTADKDYTVVITFALNRYNVTAADAQNGAVSIESNLVDHNGSTKVTLTPDAGYTIESVKVNGADVEVTTPDDTTAYFMIEDIVEDKNVIVAFKEVASADMSSVTLNPVDDLSDDPDDTLYVFANGVTVNFETDKQGIKIYDTNNKLVGGAWNKNSVAISETTSIGKISLYYKAEGDWIKDWHDVLTVTENNPLYIEFDGDAPTIKLEPAKANQYGYYNSDVSVDISTEDEGNYSGIASVKYWITTDGEETIQDTLYSYETGESKNAWADTIIVNATANNSDNVKVDVEVTDRAGNVATTSVALKINSTKPSVSVSIDGTLHTEATEGKYNTSRTATVTYIDRDSTFNKEAAMEGIVISAKNAAGGDVAISKDTMITWNQSSDDTHTAEIRFTADANYEWSVSYTNKADLSDDVIATVGASVYDFAVDGTVPTASISIDAETAWEELLCTLTFGIWKNYDITAEVTASDETAGIKDIVYYKSNADDVLTKEELDQLYADGKFVDHTYTVNADEKFTVYARITDKAGNTRYVCTAGLIYDFSKSVITLTHDDPNANGFYNEDVKVGILVNEVIEGKEAYSGIKTIDYKVVKDNDVDNPTQSENLYTFNIDKPKYADLKDVWTGDITVNAALNNSNDVKVIITVVDNAGNESTQSIEMKIDVTEPTIDISYDNDSADNAKYFKDNRTATIVVTERNFKDEDVKVTITNTDGVIPTIGEWTKTDGTGNLDDTKWTTTVTYSADGDYTFDIAYTDLADNACAGAQYGDSIAPTEFTVDKTRPVVSVSYNNNDAKNEKYFAAPRTATIVVTEHNFDVNRVEFTQTAALNGTGITIPAASWVNNGDVHTATIVFDKDGDYTFDVTVKDMAANDSEAANYGNSVAGKDFVVDQTIEKPTIGGVENGRAYKGDVIPTISFNDVNYDTYEVKLVRTRLGEKNVDVTDEFIKSVTEQAQGGSGYYDTFEKIVENDGIYTLTVKMIDKAGNEETEEYTFTVNRFGSVYEYSDELVALIKDGGQYIKKVKDDLVITEYNADRLLEGSLNILITRDGETVDVDFTSNPENINAQVGIGESGWYQYIYTIKASNFKKDGVYKISLTSKYGTVDSPENDSTSVPENSIDKQGKEIVDTMNFTVDSVAPEIRNIVNLDKAIADKDKIVDGKLNVKYTVVDVGGLKTIEIVVNGKTIQTLNEEDIAENAYNFTGSFDLEEQDGTTAHKVQIKVTDLAGNVTDTNSEDFLNEHSEDNEDSTYVFFNKVTVSRNFFVRWYANTALFWGTIGGVVVLAAAIWFLIAFKRKKKEEESK